MKYLKTFEQNINEIEIEVGDYILLQDKNTSNPAFKEFLSNNIGQYIHYIIPEEFDTIYYTWARHCKYLVRFENVPDEICSHFKNNERPFSENEIVSWSNDKEYCEALIISKKYNL